MNQQNPYSNPNGANASSPRFVQIMLSGKGELAALDSEGVIWLRYPKGLEYKWLRVGSREDCEQQRE